MSVAGDLKPMRLTLPWAVLLGLASIGVLVSIAIFLALRSHDLPREARLTGGPAGPLQSPVDIPSLPAPPPVNATSAPLTGASADAAASLAAQHAALVSACWTPLPRKPAALAWSVRVAFDAHGKQASKMMLTSVGQVRTEVTECVAGAFVPLSIAPANGPANVEVPLAFP